MASGTSGSLVDVAVFSLLWSLKKLDHLLRQKITPGFRILSTYATTGSGSKAGETKFSWDGVASQLSELYTELLTQ